MKTAINLLIFVLFIGIYQIKGQRPFQSLNIDSLKNLELIKQKFIESRTFNSDPIDLKQNKFFNRWLHSMAPHTDKDGNIVNFTAKNYFEKQRFLRTNPVEIQPATKRNPHGSWQNVMPETTNLDRPNNGRINCIAVHPTNPNIIYVGTPIGGIWVTYDGGGSWLNLNPGMDNLGVVNICINYNNPNIIYILTGGGDGFDTPSMGVLKSNNGGYDWSLTSLIFNETSTYNGYDMIMHPVDPDIMFVTGTFGVYKTTDGWETDERVLLSPYFDLAFAPNAPDTIYAAGATRVYRTVDMGDSWTKLTRIDNGISEEGFWERITMAFTPDAPQNVYLLFADNNPTKGWGYHELYFSIDYGETFTLRSSDTSIVSNQSYFNLELTVKPGSPNALFLGAVNLFYSNNFGSSFTQIANGKNLPDIHADIHHFTWVGNRLYVGTDGGISFTDDFGASFTNITDGLTINQIYDIDIKGNNLIAGSQDNGTQEWQLGDNMSIFILGGDGLECFYDPTEDIKYASTQNSRHRFAPENINITPASQRGDIWQGIFKAHPTHYDTIYSASRNFARSFDKGTTWQIFDPGFLEDGRIGIVAQSADNPDRMYISNYEEIKLITNLHTSNPNFINITSNLPVSSANRIGSIAVDPEDVNKVWVTFWGYNDQVKVYKTTTGGLGVDPWENVSLNLPNIPVFCSVYLPGSNDGIYIGTDFGVFYKDANMSKWSWFSAGLPKTRVQDLVISGNYLYAGTYGRGLWRSPHVGQCPSGWNLTSANDPSPLHSTGTQVVSAQMYITSTRVITGGQGTDVTYSAGNYIQLNPGFHAKSNNIFKAVLEGCPD